MIGTKQKLNGMYTDHAQISRNLVVDHTGYRTTKSQFIWSDQGGANTLYFSTNTKSFPPRTYLDIFKPSSHRSWI